MEYREFITQALGEASKIAQRYFGSVTASVKQADNNQVLTEADVEVGRYLVAACQEAYPDYNCIDEEAGTIDKKSEYTWVIDPIDGTSNFANGLPHFGIMIGLLHGATPIAGGIVLPAFQQLYVAEQGKGAYRNGQKITVTDEPNLLDSLIAYGIDGHQEEPRRTEKEAEKLADIVLAVRNLRSSNSAFDICAVAEGKYGLVLNKTTKLWDNVAPQILIEEAGGVYTDFTGAHVDYSDPLNRVDENFTVCAGAPQLHTQVQAVIK